MIVDAHYLNGALQVLKVVWITRRADFDYVSDIPVDGAEAKWLAWEDVPTVVQS